MPVIISALSLLEQIFVVAADARVSDSDD